MSADIQKYIKLRKALGSQRLVGAMLGLSREAMNRRERSGSVNREAMLALQALHSMPVDQRMPRDDEDAPGAVKFVTAADLLLQKAILEARQAKARKRALLADLDGRVGIARPIRGPGPAGDSPSPRWGFWLRGLSEHRRCTEVVTSLVQAMRSAGRE